MDEVLKWLADIALVPVVSYLINLKIEQAKLKTKVELLEAMQTSGQHSIEKTLETRLDEFEKRVLLQMENLILHSDRPVSAPRLRKSPPT